LPDGLSFQAATEQNLTGLIENALAQSTHDLLYFYWGGHGVITTAGERRLFYADATKENKKNLDLNALLAFLRTDYFHARALSRQIVIVDTCANFAENMGIAKELPQKSFPNGKPLENREQFVLMAAKPGELATNLGTEKTGLFTKELMAQLANQPENEWLPNMETVREQLSQRFVALREAGKTEQTPTYFYYKDWHSNERALGDVPASPIKNGKISIIAAEMKIQRLNQEIEKLEAKKELITPPISPRMENFFLGLSLLFSGSLALYFILHDINFNVRNIFLPDSHFTIFDFILMIMPTGIIWLCIAYYNKKTMFHERDKISQEIKNKNQEITEQKEFIANWQI
jgi:hypothetical protein